MEDHTHSYIKPQTLISKDHQKLTNQTKSHSHFIYKAIIFVIFVFTIPLFSSQAPESTNLSRSWELLQLIFVGILVSYGIFSRKIEESHKECDMRLDHSNSYLSKFFHFSLFFDEETNNPSGSNEDYKLQTWNSQYLRNDPLVVIENKESVLEEQRSTTFSVGDKPLFLPVRSLKSRVTEPEFVTTINGSSVQEVSSRDSGSNPSSNSFRKESDESRNLEYGEIDEYEVNELDSLSRPNLESHSPKNTSSLHVSSELVFKNEEEFERKKTRRKSKNGGNSGNVVKSVRTIRQAIKTRHIGEENEIDPSNKRRPHLETFDFRDYEKGNKRKPDENEDFDPKSVNCEGRDVDKKADEFIAKFREQIRLQRMDSFRR